MPHRSIDLTRREFLRAVSLGIAGGALSGCPPAFVPICPHDEHISDLSAPLTIDVHAHVFNGKDLQIKEFISQVLWNSKTSELHGIVESLSDVLQSLAWTLAPCASDELTILKKYESALSSCDRGEHERFLDADRQVSYDRGRKALNEALDITMKNRSAPDALPGYFQGQPSVSPFLVEKARRAEDSIRRMPEKYSDWQKLRAAEMQIFRSEESVYGYINFLLHHFNYRYVNVVDYLGTYSPRSPRKIDLLIPSLVDFDWWLAKGGRTPVSLEDQVMVMERISILTAGRVHGFVAFCPFRELMTSEPGKPGQSFSLVKDAIENRGFIGVKLYPPMGFAPYGNAGLPVWRDKSTLPDTAHKDDFGKRLDCAMAKLFEWCCAEEVPVMAHTNLSNGPYDEFEDLAGFKYWKIALNKFPGLRVGFGHFGNTATADDGGKQSREFLELMTTSAKSSGENAYADSGFFADALTQWPKLRDTLLDLYKSGSTVPLAERFMYGSDWEMLLVEKDVDSFLEKFINIMKQLEERAGIKSTGKVSLSDSFFGWNAVRYLGLQRGGATRKRLESFYAKYKIKTPDWMAKIEQGMTAN